MAVSYERARELAAARIGVGLVHPNDLRPMIVDAETVATDWGWVFFYDDERRILEGVLRYTMVGNHPVVVTHDGIVDYLPRKGETTAQCIANYERTHTASATEVEAAQGLLERIVRRLWKRVSLQLELLPNLIVWC